MEQPETGNVIAIDRFQDIQIDFYHQGRAEAGASGADDRRNRSGPQDGVQCG